MSINDDPIEMAADVGSEKYLHLGELAYPEMEISYLLACTRKAFYEDRPEARLRRHILLYWERGFFKTTMLTSFMQNCVNSVEVTMMPKFNEELPSYLFISGDYKQARLRGSVSANGKLLLPLIQRPHFIVSPELMTMLSGSGDERSGMVNFFCEVLEEGIGRVGLVSMGNAEISDETWEIMHRRGIVFSKEESTMYYRVSGTFMGASRPLRKTDVRYLSNSGFMDRISVIRWMHNRSEFEEQWRWVPRDVSKKEQKLKRLNNTIWKQLHIHDLFYPPSSLIEKALDSLNDRYENLEKQNGLPYYILRSARDSTNIAQLLTAAALSRHLQDTGLNISVLDYEKDDLRLIMNMLDTYANNRYQQAIETEEVDAQFLKEWKFYNSVRDVFAKETEPPITEDVKKEIMRITGNGESSAYKAIQKWGAKGWIQTVRPPKGKRKTSRNAVQFLK